MISKREFATVMTTCPHHFLGTAKRLLTRDELECKIRGCFDDSVILEYRNCEDAHATYLEFTGGSRLYFKPNMSYHKYEYPKGVVYIAHEDWVTMYYYMPN